MNTWLFLFALAKFFGPFECANHAPQVSLTDRLYGAVRDGQARETRELLDLGADVNKTFFASDNIQYEGDIPLHVKDSLLQIAASEHDKDNSEVLRVLLEYGADVKAVNEVEKSAIFFAAQNGAHPRVIEALIDHGAEVNAQDSRGRSPLLYSILSKRNSIENFRLLQGAGGNIHFVDEEGMSAIHYATLAGNLEIIDDLLTLGCDVDTPDSTGGTPLMMAVATEQPEIVRFLLENGADSNTQNIIGVSAKTFAEEKGNSEIINLLTL